MEVIHRKKAWGGTKTAAEAWREALPPHARCAGCRAAKRLAAWIRTYMPMHDFCRVYGPRQVAAHAMAHGGKLPIYPTVHGDMVFVTEVFACDGCAATLERAAAQHPSWCLVEIRKVPAKADRFQIAVPGASL